LLLGAVLGNAARAQVRVACVGDSITRGQGASNSATTSYVAVLQQLLGSGYVVNNYGNPGKTMISNPNLGSVAYVTTQEYTDSTNFNPNIVIIQLGTNDALDNVWTPDGGEFAADAQALINHYAALPAHPRRGGRRDGPGRELLRPLPGMVSHGAVRRPRQLPAYPLPIDPAVRPGQR
jgi:lysophospholipase L1-like esterase